MKALVFWYNGELYKVGKEKVHSIVRVDKILRIPYEGKFVIVERGKPYISLNSIPQKYAILLNDGFFIFCEKVEGVFEEGREFNGLIPEEFEGDREFLPEIILNVKPVEIKFEETQVKKREGRMFLVFSTDVGYMAFDMRDVISVDVELERGENTVFLTNFSRFSIKVEQDGEIYDLWVLGILGFAQIKEVESSKNPMFRETFKIRGQNVGVPNLKFITNRENIKYIVESLVNLLKEVDLPEIREAYESLSKLVK